jgi:pimeloyl-ACP methyl ester carboxylesterase
MRQQKSTFIDHVIPLADGRRLGYSEYGAKHGTPVLFFHGAPGSSYIHQDLAAIAAQNDVHLIAVDRPGYGLSDPQPNRTFLSFADDINALTNTLGVKKFSIIGFSAGSPYPIACAYKFPDRITKIVLVGSLAPVSISGVMEGMSPMAAGLYALAQSNPDELRTTFASVAPSASALLGAMSASAGTWDKHILQARATEFELEYKQTLLGGIEGLASDFILNSGNWDFPINECNTEVHLFSGKIDQNTPSAMTHYLSTQLLNSHVHLFQNEGHFVLYPHWEEILRAVI